jgi:predicted esterase
MTSPTFARTFPIFEQSINDFLTSHVVLCSIDTDPPTGLLESVQAVHALIDAEIKSGVPANRIMVAGFSQGAAMSLRSGFTYPQSLAGIMPLSGYLPGRVSFAIHEANAKTALRAFHGDADQVVQLDFMRMALRKLRELGATFGDAAVASSDAPLPLNVYRHMGHSSSDQEMKDMTQFLQKCLPQVSPKADL